MFENLVGSADHETAIAECRFTFQIADAADCLHHTIHQHAGTFDWEESVRTQVQRAIVEYLDDPLARNGAMDGAGAYELMPGWRIQDKLPCRSLSGDGPVVEKGTKQRAGFVWTTGGILPVAGRSMPTVRIGLRS